jgi:prevent-host-death family protein
MSQVLPQTSPQPGSQVGVAQIGAFEAKNKLGSLLDRVEQGEEIVITRHGKPVARLVPNPGGFDRAQARAAFDRLRARAALVKGGPFDWEEFKADRDAGRPGMDL